MSQPKSKPTDGWAKLLQAEIARRGTRWTDEHKDFTEIQAMRKAAGLAHGLSSTQRWIGDAKKAGRIEQVDGRSPNTHGKLVRVTKYLVK
jgi:hypothetical protein